MRDIPELIALYTDFGIGSHYLSQVRLRLFAEKVTLPVVDLCADAPAFDPYSSAYFLASFIDTLPAKAMVIAVVDPGVGGDRRAIAAKCDGRWLIGPDNGLLSQVVRNSSDVFVQSIALSLENRARTFDGRDLFAPAAAVLCNGSPLPGERIIPKSLVGHDWPSRLGQIIYIDHYGNAVTGLSGNDCSRNTQLLLNEQPVAYAETFSSVMLGKPFWYVNANGLIEIAVNRGSAADGLGLHIGMSIDRLVE